MVGDDGGTSGIGRRAIAMLLRERVDWTVILLAGSSPRVDELKALPGAGERLAIVDADLANLGSVGQACEEVARLLGGCRIDALALNAGIQTVGGDQMSADGLELSFAVNCLAHFLIVERLKRLMRPGGGIVTTSSEVHDRDAFCLMGIGRATRQDPLELADPARSQAHIASLVARGEARYCASKLLNLMHVRHRARVARHQRGCLQLERGARYGDRARPRLAPAARLEVRHAAARADPSRCAGVGPVSRRSRAAHSPRRMWRRCWTNMWTAGCRGRGRAGRTIRPRSRGRWRWHALLGRFVESRVARSR